MKRNASALALAGAFLSAAGASASTAIEFPDQGVAQFSRGGAWLATATDPIAGYFNPAALATQATGVSLGMNLVMQEICFDRRDQNGDPPAVDATAVEVYPRVCNANPNFPRFLPNVAGVWRVTDRLGLGLTIVPPSSFGRLEWPAVVPVTNQFDVETQIPAPQRFQSLGVEGTILFPTLAAGYEIAKGLRLGAGFVSGIVVLKLETASTTTAASGPTAGDTQPNTKSTIEVKDLFVPGVVAGAHWSASDNFDLGLWYKWFDRVGATGDLTVLAPYYNPTLNGLNQAAETTKVDGDVRFGLVLPMEARAGVRYHLPRDTALAPVRASVSRQDPFPVRDPLRDDLFDVELDLTWANNSAADEFEVRIPSGVTVKGTGDLGEVPANADRPTGYKDSFGARLGGQWAASRNLFGVRAGTWLESPAVDAEDLNVTGVPALRGGFGGGIVVRIGPIDAEAGYQHIWNAGLDNGRACVDAPGDPIAKQTGCGRARGIAGSGADSAGNIPNRTFHGVNGGSVTQSANAFSVGAVARF